MARRFTVSLPDHLYRRAQEELPPEVNWSGLLADALREKLAEVGECPHGEVRCTGCGVRIERTAAAGG